MAKFYADNFLGNARRELAFLRPTTRAEFAARRPETLGSPDALFAFAQDEFGLYQRRREFLTLVELIDSRAPTTACEIGTWRGGTNFLLGELVPSLRMIIGVDLLLQNHLRLRYATRPQLTRRLVRGNSRSAPTKWRIRTVLGERQLDLLFIDGDHHYHAVKSDFETYRDLVADGGLVVFHDIVPDYRTRYGVRGGPWSGGVPDWWNEVKGCYPSWEIIESPTQNAFGIGVIELGDGGHGRPPR